MYPSYHANPPYSNTNPLSSYSTHPHQFSREPSSSFANDSSSIKVKIDIIPSLQPLLDLLPNHPSSGKAMLGSGFDCFLKIEGAGNLFLVLGILITKDLIIASKQQGNNSTSNKSFLLSSFGSVGVLSTTDESQNRLLTKLGIKFKDFISYVQNSSLQFSENPLDQNFIGRFIVDRCKGDSELLQSIIQLSRCVLIKFMVNEGVYSKEEELYEKLIKNRWAESDSFFTRIVQKFSDCLKYKLRLFSLTNGYMVDKEFPPRGGAEKEETIIEFNSHTDNFVGILYKSSYKVPDRDPSQLSQFGRSSGSIDQQQPLNNSSQEKFTKCSICDEDILESLVYTNEACGHNYCLYCLQENDRMEMSFCYLGRCPRRVIPSKVKEFVKLHHAHNRKDGGRRPGGEERNSIMNQPQIGKPSIDLLDRIRYPPEDKSQGQSQDLNKAMIYPKRGKCTLCYKELNAQNSMFINYKCQHVFCINCLRSRSIIDGKCFERACPQSMDLSEFKAFMQQAGESIEAITARCSKCFKSINASQVFQNPQCGHFFCVFCIENWDSQWCPLTSCSSNLDEEKLLAFKEGLLAGGGNLLMQKLPCFSCGKEIEIHTQHGSQPDYVKCTLCSAFSCFRHEGPMSACLCFCPKCLGETRLNTLTQNKECRKCGSSYCVKCTKEIGKDGKCLCSPERKNVQEKESPQQQIVPNVQQQKNDKAEVNGGGLKSRTSYPNSCSLCEDFRTFPEFASFPCKHRICEYCVILRRKELEDVGQGSPLKCFVCNPIQQVRRGVY